MYFICFNLFKIKDKREVSEVEKNKDVEEKNEIKNSKRKNT